MILANYTPDAIQWQHVGQIGILKPNDVKEFTDARGNHILNKWGPRGLIRVQLDGDHEADRAKAMKIYENFWIRQVTNFNRQNEVNKNENKAYVSPTAQLRGKAEELEIELIGSWTYTPPSENVKVTALEKEVATLKGMLTEMVDMVRELKEKPKVPVAINTEELISQYRNMKSEDFTKFLIDHSGEYDGWPVEVKDNIKEKWARLNPDEDFLLPG